jgi:hypothetical protein
MTSETATPSRRVLVVDDEPMNRRLLGDLVGREGFEAILAGGGQAALDIIDQTPIDLVLLDLMMPQVDGMAVLEALRARGRLGALPVVVVTAHDDRSARRKALAAGAIDFITKPIDHVEVACKVRSLTELGRLRADALHQAQTQAAATQLQKVEAAVAGLPLIIFEMQVVEPSVIGRNWVIGDLSGHETIEAGVLTMQQRLERVHPADKAAVDRCVGDVVRGPGRTFSIRLRFKIGDTYQWRFVTAAFEPATGTLRGIIIGVDDQVILEQSLQQSQKMDAIGRLASGIAHDFNNLLGVIVSYGAFIRDGLPQDDPLRADCIEVLSAAERAAGLTGQLLAFSRQQPTETKALDLNQRVAQLHKLLYRTLGGRVELRVIPSARPAVVEIDPVQFDQVMLNLAVNARDAMPDGGHLRITIEHVHATADAFDKVRVRVVDTGAGIDEETIGHIFEPFFTTKPKGGGTGLGLATSFGIVTKAGGTISVQSTLGEGSTFTVEWPAHRAQRHRETTPIPRTGNGEHVLVVEDEPALRQAAARVLQAAGYQVHVADSGLAAMQKLEALGPRLDALVIDVVLPDYSGYDVLDYAARVTPTAATLLTSGTAEHPTTSLRRLILRKPVSPRALVEAMQAALNARSLIPREPSPAPVPAASSGNTVLVIEDEPAAQRAMVRILASRGFATEVVSTVAAALEFLADAPDLRLIFCDLNLSDGPGIAVFEWIQHHRPDLTRRTIILTGGAMDAASEQLLNSGLFRILHKPLRPDRLIECLALETRSGLLPSPAPPKLVTAARAPAAERVLIIDDDASLTCICARALRDGGFVVENAYALAEAREALARSTFDCIVLDLTLPDGDGMMLLRALREQEFDYPVVVVSGTPSIQSAAEVLRSRICEYLPKPFATEVLLAAVRTAVNDARVFRLRRKLLATRFGGDAFVDDIAGTAALFDRALPKIRMVFQPIVRAADSSVYGYEALLRCDEPALASPLKLLGAAEVLGRTNELGRAVRAAVARTMAQRRDHIESIFINLHPAELRADILTDALEPIRQWADRVVLEVTERVSLEDCPALQNDLKRIRAQGYRLAVDDLGEGYAGLSSLVTLQPDIAKLDMSLVRDVHRFPLKRDIVAALVDLARRSGILVVAEGIETVEERDALVELGCDLLQGYYFARPGPAFPVVQQPSPGAAP